jgi:DNA-binding response OmpR family regulator
MSRLSYDNAETLVYDPVSANRTQTRAALYTLGFRRIESVASLDAFASALQKRSPDLALCEAQGAEAELCDLIQKVRLGGSYNPFIVIIVTAWEKSNTLAGRVINSGADDLLLRPYSVSALGQRIKTHTEKRKGFVITTDYVGPDRRRDENRPSEVELFSPPNSLRMKAQEGMADEDVASRMEAELRRAREIFSAEKLRRDAFQICILWRLLQSYLPSSPKYEADARRLGELAESVAERCAGTGYAAAVDWCEHAKSAVEGLLAGVDRNAAMHLLGHAVIHIDQVFAPGIEEGERLRRIDATVESIYVRTATELAS